MNFILRAYTLQDIGSRNSQEDCFFPPFIDPCHYDETKREWTFYDGSAHNDDRLFIVCDGSGEHDRGELASRTVVKAMSDSILSSAPIEGLFSDDMMHNALKESIEMLHSEHDPYAKQPMSTAMAALKFHADGATVAHLGNSRVYHFRPANEKEASKILFRTQDSSENLSPVTSDLNVLDHITDIKEGDLFLLCTDGFHECFTDEELCSMICDPNYLGAERSEMLLHLLQGKEDTDNITAIVIRVKKVMNVEETEATEESMETLQPGTVLRSQYLDSTGTSALVYHIEKVLGKGAFGVSYLVSASITIKGQLGTVHTGVKVAMKEFFMHNEMKRHGNEVVITAHEDKVNLFREKFRQEALQLSLLSHPNIVKVLDVFEANNTIYYTMEYVPDGSLHDYVNKNDGLPEQEALGVIRQIGSALNYLHLNKLLHLDVKPANVMRDVANDTVKLIDFGLARRYTESGEAIGGDTLGAGTSGYAPMEQSEDTVIRPFSPQMDVYALGATYYKILTGQVPNNAVYILSNGLNTSPLVSKKVSQKSIDAIKAAMQPHPEDRLKSVNDFLMMLPSVDDASICRKKKRFGWVKWVILALIAIAAIAFIL